MSHLFRASLNKLTRPATRSFSRHGTQNPVLNGVLKNNATYVTFIVGAAVAVEFIYGKATYAVWSMLNRGKLYDQIDWSQFNEDDEDEDEDDE